MYIIEARYSEPQARGGGMNDRTLQLASPTGAAPASLQPELIRALNEKIAIIDGMAELLLLSTSPDRTAKAALQAIRRQAQGVRELFLRP